MGMRKKEFFTFEFSGRIRIKAKTPEEASNIFRKELENLHNKDFVDWYEISFENINKKERFCF